MDADQELLLELAGSAAVIRIDRPAKRNAWSRDLLRLLPRRLEAAAASGADAVVLTGGAERFSAGFDLAELRGSAPGADVEAELTGACSALRDCGLPTIAAVEGPCMGLGVELALACDLRVVSADSFFEIPAARLGIRYRESGISGIVTAVGPMTASRLVALGERIAGARALECGIASHVVAAGATLPTALELVGRLEGADPAAVADMIEVVRRFARHG